MKIHTQTRRKGLAHLLATTLALVLAVGLVFAAPAGLGVAYAEPDSSNSDSSTTGGSSDSSTGDSAAQPTTLTKTYKLTVDVAESYKTDNPDLAVLLENHAVKVDVYKIADAVKVEGYDVYNYRAVPAFENVLRNYVTDETRRADWTVDTSDGFAFRYTPVQGKDGWNDLPQVLSKAIWPFEGTPVNAAPVATADLGEAIELPGGLYLTTIHGTEDVLSAPVRLVSQDEKTYTLATMAYTDSQVYYFNPQLAALPALVGGETDTTLGAAYSDTATLIAKATEQPRTADLRVTKTLANYNGPATFVIAVAATTTDGPQTKVNSVSFDATSPNSQDVLLWQDTILAGSDVTVTETYSGHAYQAVGETSQTVTVRPGRIAYLPYDNDETRYLAESDPVAVEMVNEASDSANGGGSVVNHFEPNADNTWWNWLQRIWDAATNAWREIDHGEVDRTSN